MGRGQNDGRRQPASPRKRAQPSWNQRDEAAEDFASFATWNGDDFSQIYGDPEDEPEDARRTAVIPAITLPSVPAVQHPADDHYGDEPLPPLPPPLPPLPRRSRHGAPQDPYEAYKAPEAPRQNRALVPAIKQEAAPGTNRMPAVRGKKPKVPPGVDVVLVPGNARKQRGLRALVRRAGLRLVGPLHVVRMHRKALTVFALALILVSVLVNTTGLLSNAGLMSAGQWIALASIGGPAPTPAPPPAPDITNPAHYVSKYGFDYPSSTRAIPSDEFKRLTYMLPFAYKATAAYDRRYHKSIEPEMLVWWTHAEGIRGRINYSNCANNPPRAGYSYFTNIQNCPHASFWQLGYGNQFSVIYVLKNAFRDLYGDPNDKQLVQKVGQWVLNYDRSKGTYPVCGGYSCTFPARTIDSIMSGINTTLGVQTEDNWWASVLSRDPAINCYMIAHALTYFNHEATRRWTGNYYYEPYWQNESNRLGDILKAWPALRRAAHL